MSKHEIKISGNTQVVAVSEEEEDRALYCPRCGKVLVASDDMVGFLCTPQPACDHVHFVFDDYNHDFTYLDGELEKRISALRKNAERKDEEEEFSSFDWVFKESAEQFETLKRTDHGIGCSGGPVAYTVVVGVSKSASSSRKKKTETARRKKARLKKP